MDEILQAAVKEIAVAGTSGILVKDLWDQLRTTDVFTKRWIWLQLFSVESILILRDQGDGSPIIPDEYDEGKIRLIASDNLHRPALGLYDPAIRMSADQMKILRQITQMKEHGILQSALSKINNMEPKAIFYNLKLLLDLGIITKVFSEGNKNILVHSQYAHLFKLTETENPEDQKSQIKEDQSINEWSAPPEEFCFRISQYLMQKEQQSATEQEIIEHFNLTTEKFTVCRRILANAASADQVKLAIKAQDETSMFINGLRLIRPYEKPQEPNLVVELPLLYQLLATIINSGSMGVRQMDLVRLCHNPKRNIYIAIQQLIAHYDVIAVKESARKMTTMRLFYKDYFPLDQQLLLQQQQQQQPIIDNTNDPQPQKRDVVIDDESDQGIE
ncbi:MAG: hypothetical protein EZS28_021922 [Streblomastix strix]|uniref:Uncharacterized protein n=1 Tax=Streblomastix strix TaxID=222440 RepID=A0A5J4VJ76_9EUKA|nr:MAG: hypothetical protein EZS28_021922 [Streblomastix strix]